MRTIIYIGHGLLEIYKSEREEKKQFVLALYLKLLRIETYTEMSVQTGIYCKPNLWNAILYILGQMTLLLQQDLRKHYPNRF